MEHPKSIFGLSLLLGIAAPLTASPLGAARSRTDKADWNNLKVLTPGQRVEVVDMDSKSLKGTFISVSEEGVSVRVKTGDVTVPRANVRRILDREHTRRGRNALIGAAIGGGAGWPMGLPGCADSRRGCGVSAIATGALGAGLGAGLGALAPGHPTIYQAKNLRHRRPP